MSLEDDKKLLEAVRTWTPPEELHPMAVSAWMAYEAAGLTMSPEAIQFIREELDKYGDDGKEWLANLRAAIIDCEKSIDAEYAQLN